MSWREARAHSNTAERVMMGERSEVTMASGCGRVPAAADDVPWPAERPWVASSASGGRGGTTAVGAAGGVVPAGVATDRGGLRPRGRRCARCAAGGVRVARFPAASHAAARARGQAGAYCPGPWPGRGPRQAVVVGRRRPPDRCREPSDAGWQAGVLLLALMAAGASDNVVVEARGSSRVSVGLSVRVSRWTGAPPVTWWATTSGSSATSACS